ncbi:MAG: MarR family transcriptional regulator [Eubacteriales bacterium]|nr:MarR family transcriptional regulator [Eubacteriales bacterium]
MTQRFETFVTSITQIYRCIQKIKTHEMLPLGLKSTHVMCLFYLQQHPDGLTSAQLAALCEEDKGAISRALSTLESKGLAAFGDQPGQRKRYRTRITLTAAGQEAAQRMDASIQAAVEKGGQGLSDEGRAAFYNALQTISQNLQAVCSEQGETI